MTELAAIKPHGNRRMVIEQREADLTALQHVHGFIQSTSHHTHLCLLQHAAVVRQPVCNDGAGQRGPLWPA